MPPLRCPGTDKHACRFLRGHDGPHEVPGTELSPLVPLPAPGLRCAARHPTLADRACDLYPAHLGPHSSSGTAGQDAVFWPASDRVWSPTGVYTWDAVDTCLVCGAEATARNGRDQPACAVHAHYYAEERRGARSSASCSGCAQAEANVRAARRRAELAEADVRAAREELASAGEKSAPKRLCDELAATRGRLEEYTRGFERQEKEIAGLKDSLRQAESELSVARAGQRMLREEQAMIAKHALFGSGCSCAETCAGLCGCEGCQAYERVQHRRLWVRAGWAVVFFATCLGTFAVGARLHAWVDSCVTQELYDRRYDLREPNAPAPANEVCRPAPVTSQR